MKLTPLEIKQQTFDKSIRGYDVSEVQAFLNLVSNEWEHLVSKNNELNEQINKLNEKLKHYERVEEALHETLQAAKESAEQKLEGAEKETRNMIEKAEMQANMIVREASQQRQLIRQSILRLLDRRDEIVGGIRSYLEIAQGSLKQFSKDEANLFALPPEIAELSEAPGRQGSDGSGEQKENDLSEKEPEDGREMQARPENPDQTDSAR